MTLPLWAFLVLLVFATWAVLDRLLVPAVRWRLRRNAERVLEEVATRLPIKIEPLRLTRRRVLVDRLVHDPKVQEAVEAEMAASGAPRAVVLARVERYAREIVPAFNAWFYFRVGYAAAKRLARALYRVRLGASDEAGLSSIPEKSTVVFVMNHRSNMDYVLVGYLAAEKAALSYAVGEWARLFPLEQLIRATGAYFVRRASGDVLYRRVLERWIAMATANGVTQAVFPEGGLSRDGKLRPPKVGILDYVVRAFDPSGERDVVFVPVGINFDRVLEDRTLLLDAEPAARKPGRVRAAATLLAFLARNASLLATFRWRRFGYAVANLGSPISLRSFLSARGADPSRQSKEQRAIVVSALAGELMGAISRLVPALPVPLVAEALVGADRPMSELEIKAAVWARVAALERAGARVHVPRNDRDYAVSYGLRMLVLRRLVRERDGLHEIVPEERRVVAYYANSLAPPEPGPA